MFSFLLSFEPDAGVLHQFFPACDGLADIPVLSEMFQHENSFGYRCAEIAACKPAS